MGLTPQQLEQLLKDVAEMKTALIGDSRYEQKGLVGDVSDLKKWKGRMNEKYIWVVGVVTASWFFICLIAFVGYEWAKAKFGMKAE